MLLLVDLSAYYISARVAGFDVWWFVLQNRAICRFDDPTTAIDFVNADIEKAKLSYIWAGLVITIS